MFLDRAEKNMADYHTKHHSIKHHQNVRSKYVWDHSPSPLDTTPITGLQGCVGARPRTPDRQTVMTSAKHDDSVRAERQMTNSVHSYNSAYIN